jgi:putative two-component system response regulator
MSSSHAEELSALLRSSKSSNASELKPVLARLSLEVKNRLERGSYSSYDFIAATVDAFSKIKGSANADIRLDCLFDAGIFFHRAGFATDAVLSARLMSDLATRTASRPWIRKANTLAGIAHGDIGDLAESIVRHANALVLAIELEDFIGERSSLTGLATSFNYGGLYHESIRCSERVIAITRETTAVTSDLIVAASYTNIAQSYLALEDYKGGFDAIQTALKLSHEPTDGRSAFSRCIREFTYVQLALELGKLEFAREHSALCRKHSHWGNNVRCGVLADITAGLCETNIGNVERGFKYLESALSHSTDFALKIDALTALAKAYDQVGKPERALEYLKGLLGAVRATREKGIFALMSLRSDDTIGSSFLPSADDLRALELREAKLEAKVAKREVFHSRMEMLERLAVTADLKEESSGEHGYRVGRLAALLAEDLGWESDACLALDMAARLHDIGKIGVPDRILFNSQKLKDAEREFITTHTVIGSELLAKSDIPHLRIAQEIALYHHEWWNGQGYPSRLRGKRIPLHARIVALADVFDALTHGRPFARPWSAENALAEIRGRRGTQFDPDLTDRFVALLEKLLLEHTDLDSYLGKAGQNSPFLQARNKIRQLLADKQDNERRATISGNETRH